MQMSITPLSDIQPRRLDYTICVRISRMWEYKGPNEENDIIHLDLVLIDNKVFYYAYITNSLRAKC